jgi:hypothetical protein
MGDSIMGRMNEMNSRMDELELSIGDLMNQAGLESSSSSTSKSNSPTTSSKRSSEMGTI